jgi:uncharacterized protein YndB with AHSA1/START domain
MTVTEVHGVPRKVTFTTVVDRPPAELYALVADPHRHAELDGSGTVGKTVKGPERLSAGDKFSVNMKMFGLPYRITSKVTHVVPDSVLEWKHPAGHKWRWEFESTDAGTRVTETFDYSALPGIQAKALEALGFPKRNGDGVRQTLEKLART